MNSLGALTDCRSETPSWGDFMARTGPGSRISLESLFAKQVYSVSVIFRKYIGWMEMNVRYSPVTEIKWSLPRAVCSMRVQSKPGKARFNRDAVKSSTIAMAVIANDSPGRSRLYRDTCVRLSQSVTRRERLLPQRDQFQAIVGLRSKSPSAGHVRTGYHSQMGCLASAATNR